jgi:two-component system NtrC family response regulator
MIEKEIKILVADDDSAVRSSMRFLLEKKGYKVYTAASPTEIIDSVKTYVPGLVILDMNYSRTTNGEEGIELLQKIKILHKETHVILLTAWASLPLAVEGIKKGAFDFLSKPWDNQQLLEIIQSALAESTNSNISANRKELDNRFDLDFLIGDHPIFLEKLSAAMRIAPTNAPVLITGESGTGKELFAEAIHKNSRRKDKPFIKVNLGGLSQSLFESEMFGHTKGAFTDAHSDRKGRVEMADGGTLFLDEIGELDLNSQVKLLRFLQEQTYERLGDSVTRKTDIRIICATNRDLPFMIAQGEFREDLYYRINLISIELPSLRETYIRYPYVSKCFFVACKPAISN